MPEKRLTCTWNDTYVVWSMSITVLRAGYARGDMLAWNTDWNALFLIL